jgi:hypothetical protein
VCLGLACIVTVSAPRERCHLTEASESKSERCHFHKKTSESISLLMSSKLPASLFVRTQPDEAKKFRVDPEFLNRTTLKAVNT